MTTRRWLLLAAILLLAGCGGDGKTTGQAAATTAVASTTLTPTTSVTPASSATGASFRFRGMTLTVPARWKVETNSDGATVANGQACVHSDLLGRDVCPGFEVYGPDGIAHGYENRAYRLDQPFHPGADVSPCTTAPDNGLEGGHTLVKGGFARVGPRPPTTAPGGSPVSPPAAPSPPASPMSSRSGTCPSPGS